MNASSYNLHYNYRLTFSETYNLHYNYRLTFSETFLEFFGLKCKWGQLHWFSVTHIKLNTLKLYSAIIDVYKLYSGFVFCYYAIVSIWSIMDCSIDAAIGT